MAKLTKVNFKISIPDEFELDEKKYLISSVKENFPSENFYPQIKLLIPEEDNKSRYKNVSFNLSPDICKDGILNLAFDNNRAIIECDASFNISVRPQFQDDFDNPDAKWSFNGIYINHSILGTEYDASPDGDTYGELISGKGVEEFSYEARVGTVNVKLLLIDVST
tara:strand:- start:423 stop:920 length:498 start_codon:yes stop_codon:yes gene_type:complete